MPPTELSKRMPRVSGFNLIFRTWGCAEPVKQITVKNVELSPYRLLSMVIQGIRDSSTSVLEPDFPTLPVML